VRIGVDFDNTIACYEGMFFEGAREKNWIPDNIGRSKTEVRDYLRLAGKEDLWTELQGIVYGPLMSKAQPFPGVLDFFHCCRKKRIPVYIVSHRTQTPYLGEPFNLHQAAYDWIQSQGLIGDNIYGISPTNVFFELTKSEKLERISNLGCTHFIDDLPEFLEDASFPEMTERILFDPTGRNAKQCCFPCFRSWHELIQHLGIGS